MTDTPLSAPLTTSGVCRLVVSDVPRLLFVLIPHENTWPLFAAKRRRINARRENQEEIGSAKKRENLVRITSYDRSSRSER